VQKTQSIQRVQTFAKAIKPPVNCRHQTSRNALIDIRSIKWRHLLTIHEN